MASAHDPESVRAGIGPAEARERDPRRERARNEGRGPEIGGEGSRSEAETIGGTSIFRAELSAVTKDCVYIIYYSQQGEQLLKVQTTACSEKVRLTFKRKT